MDLAHKLMAAMVPKTLMLVGGMLFVLISTGRSLKVDPIGTGRLQSTSRGEGGRPRIFFKAGSATTEGPGPDPQYTFTPNLLSLGIYFQRPAGKVPW